MRLKICGVQSIEEAQKLTELGVDFIGLNFVPESSRRIAMNTGKAVAARVRGLPIKVVALFQNQPLELVQNHVSEIKPDYVQLHGRETDDFIGDLKTPSIKSITGTEQVIPAHAKYYLLDREKRGEGPVVDTKVVAKIVNQYPGRVFLAGGLNPANLAEVLDKVKPFAVDIAGGARTDNVIDFDKVRKVLAIVRRQS